MRMVLGLIAALAMAGLATTNATAYERWLRIHNDTNSDLCYVYITHVDESSWGRDILGPCISPGHYRTVNPGYQQGYCMVDMKFVFDDDDEVVEYEYNICEGTDFTIY